MKDNFFYFRDIGKSSWMIITLGKSIDVKIWQLIAADAKVTGNCTVLHLEAILWMKFQKNLSGKLL